MLEWCKGVAQSLNIPPKIIPKGICLDVPIIILRNLDAIMTALPLDGMKHHVLDQRDIEQSTSKNMTMVKEMQNDWGPMLVVEDPWEESNPPPGMSPCSSPSL